MTKKTRIHLLFWTLFAGLSFASYIPVWHNMTLITGFANFGWLILTFYLTYFFAHRLFSKTKQGRVVWGNKYFWLILSALFIYIYGTYLTDKHLLKNYGGPTIAAYCIVRLLMVFSFIMISVLLAGYEKKIFTIALLKQDNSKLQIEKGILEYEVEQLRKQKQMAIGLYEHQNTLIIQMRKSQSETYGQLRQMIEDIKYGTGF
jgi:hypothetical protein